MEPKEYQEQVRKLFDTNSQLKFSNGEKAHAKVILVEFFLRARDEVLIFCEDADEDVYGDSSILESMQKAMENGVSITVVVQKKARAIKFIQEGRKLHDDLTVPGTFKCLDGSKYRNVPFNFAIMDRRAVRLEPDRSKPVARASANWPDMAKHLSKQFEKIASRLEPAVVEAA